MKEPEPRDRSATPMTRRDFHRHAARAATAALVSATVWNAGADEPPTVGADDPEAAAVRDAVARVRAAAPSLPESDSAELESQVKSVLELQASLRRHPVADGAEPSFVFEAMAPRRKARP